MKTPAVRKIGTVKAVVYAVLVHIVVAALLVVSLRWHQTTRPRPPAKPPAVNATVIDDSRVKQEVEAIRKEEARKLEEELAAQRRLEESKRQADEAEKKRVAEEQRIAELKRKQEDERKRLAEKKRETEEAERKRVAEQKRAAEEAERKREAERVRVAEEAERKREAERRKEAESALREQMAAEEKQREDARAARAMAEVERFTLLIRQRVERAWIRPGAVAAGTSCVVRVRLVPGGEVVDARVVRSSGNAAFDRSVESAVYKASPLPLPTDTQMFEYFRELEFTFKPGS